MSCLVLCSVLAHRTDPDSHGTGADWDPSQDRVILAVPACCVAVPEDAVP